jgi:hypothetical protein
MIKAEPEEFLSLFKFAQRLVLLTQRLVGRCEWI